MQKILRNWKVVQGGPNHFRRLHACSDQFRPILATLGQKQTLPPICSIYGWVAWNTVQHFYIAFYGNLFRTGKFR